MEVRSTCGNCSNHIVEQCSCFSPPPDVVEAARRLQIIYRGYLKSTDIETVCKWVLNKVIDK